MSGGFLSKKAMKDVLNTPNEELEKQMAKTEPKEEAKPNTKDEKPSRKNYWIAGGVVVLAAALGAIALKKWKS